MSPTDIPFTNRDLLEFKNESKKWVYLPDPQTPGLRLGVGPNGHKTFYLYKRIRGRPERLKIGAFPDLSIAYARTQAWALKAAIGTGANPVEAQRAVRGAPTLEELFNEYIEKHAKAKAACLAGNAGAVPSVSHNAGKAQRRRDHALRRRTPRHEAGGLLWSHDGESRH